MKNDFISHLDLKPHPEGGYYKETYRSKDSTGIYYLLAKGDKSRLHRIKSDEMWHFYSGDPLVVVEITSTGVVKETEIGPKTTFQYVVPANTWFGAYLPEGSEYALVGCTVAPAFEFVDFELGDKASLLKEFPQASSIIEKLL